ncbi:hypothetical protein GCM10009117_15380 [Gangjinia marincola]|uniref:Uncharacterized protein n=1 Tax=Gangjinia marincola TaxID=578463 RepID=A0ABP3XWK1_9FLAO
MKKYVFIFFVLVLFSCQEDIQEDSPLIQYIPANSALVASIEDFSVFKEHIDSNEFISLFKDFSLFKGVASKVDYLTVLQPKEPILVSVTQINRDDIGLTLISKNEVVMDSTRFIKAGDITYNEENIEIYNFNKKEIYRSNLNKTFVYSDSKLILENIIRSYKDTKKPDPAFERVYKSGAGNNTTFYFNQSKVPSLFNEYFKSGVFSSLSGFSDWVALDVDASNSMLRLNGISIANDSVIRLQPMFREVTPGISQLASIAPINTAALYGFTYNDLLLLQKNDPNSSLDFKSIAATGEVGILYMDKKEVIVIRSTDPELTDHSFLDQKEQAKTYRENIIYHFEKKNFFKDRFGSLFPTVSAKFYTVLDSFFVFAEDAETLEDIIANFQNKTVLENSPYYTSFSEDMSDQSHLYYLINHDVFVSRLAEALPKKDQTKASKLNFNSHRFSAIQLTHDTDFAHVNILIKKSQQHVESQPIAQLLSITLDAPAASKPQFFRNHLTNQLDIAVQDEDHTLYLISNKGKVYWKKKLDAAILGEVQAVDLFKNKKLQLAFTTANGFYVIDRNGKEVAPFPLTFNETITQPLAIFDYDQNRNYRFAITTGKNVALYNTEAKQVKGFEFSSTPSPITQAPVHNRKGSKDYILISEENGTLHILNRRGQSRIDVKDKVASINPWFLYTGMFTSINEQGELIQITDKGNVKKSATGIKDNAKLDATAKTIAINASNKLKIKQNLVDLDYGRYSAPEIFYLDDKLYIALTNLESNQVFLFDSNAKLLPHFPVYGSSQIDLNNMDRSGALEFVVKGEGNRILVYRL